MKSPAELMQFFKNFILFFLSFVFVATGFPKSVYDFSYLLPLPETEEQLPNYLNANDVVGEKLFQSLANQFIKSSAPGFPAMFDLEISFYIVL